MLLAMITFYLQCHYKKSLKSFNFRSSQVKEWESAGPTSSAEARQSEIDKIAALELHRHLMAFFKYYGIDLDQRDSFVSVRKGGFLQKRDIPLEAESQAEQNKKPSKFTLSIESPLDYLYDDIGIGAYCY